MEQWEKEYLEEIQESKKDEEQKQKEFQKAFKARMKEVYKENRARLNKIALKPMIPMLIIMLIVSLVYVLASAYLIYSKNDELFDTLSSLYKMSYWIICIPSACVAFYRLYRECVILTNIERIKGFLAQWTDLQYEKISVLLEKYRGNKEAMDALLELKEWIQESVAAEMAAERE